MLTVFLSDILYMRGQLGIKWRFSSFFYDTPILWNLQ